MLIRNAKDSAGKAIEVWLRDGKIAAVGLGLLVPEGEEVLDAKGRTVLPAFIDTHCHWRTPGFEYKEDISTGSAAAAAGGYTFVNLMPNTKPVCSSAEIAHAVEAEAARVGLCDANQTVSITKDFDGKTLDHLLTLPEGIKFITEDGNGVMNNAVMARAFAIATERGLTIMSHAEDREISPWDYRLAENIETVRNCHLAEYYGTRLHMCHVSTRESVDAVRMSRMRGARVSCEVTPHHLWFDDSRLTYRVNPPIRKADDVTALIDAIKDGTVTCIGTDHAPHTAEEKEKGAAGMVGLETAFGVCYTKLCREQRLPLEMLSFLMSAGPAAVLGLALDDWIDAHFYNSVVVAVMLIVYGIAFILIERRPRVPTTTKLSRITYRQALIVGAWQVLALIPGTSRSGSTIIGGLLCGMSRACASQFTFFLAIPVMAGASGLKLVKFLAGGGVFTVGEIGALLVGCIVAFVVSILAIRFLMDYVKKHTFTAFGWYRIALGIVVLGVWALQTFVLA